MMRFGWKLAAAMLLVLAVGACGSANKADPTTNASNAIAQVSASHPALDPASDCVATPATQEALAAADTRWQQFDFWVDRIRRRVARPADKGDLSGIGHFCGTWSVVVRQPGADKPSGIIGLRIAGDGRYTAILRDGLADDNYAFHIDRGQIAVSDKGLRLVSAQGWNDEGQWLPVTGGDMVAMMQQKILWFRPIGPNARRQIDTVFQAAASTGKGMTSNVALALAVAKAWAADVELRALEVRPHDGEFANPVIVPSFYSPGKNATMAMLFDPAAGQLPAGKTYVGDATGTTRAIPVDAMALPSLGGGGRDDGPAVLRWWGEGASARLWWVFTRPMVASGRGDICYDVAQGGQRDCRALFGDNIADYERRLAQVNAARRRAQSRSPANRGDRAPFVLRPPCSASFLQPGDVCNDFGTDKIVQ